MATYFSPFSFQLLIGPFTQQQEGGPWVSAQLVCFCTPPGATLLREAAHILEKEKSLRSKEIKKKRV